MRYHRMNRQLFRDNPRRERQQFNYTLVTSAFRFGTQIPVTPHLNSQDDPAQAKEWAVYNRRCKHIFTSDWDEEERFPGLKRLADQIVANEPEDANNYDKAKVLESWFLEPRRFSYSLDFDEVNAMRNPNLDPVEDFVVNHRTGHCQYFASALALMLKSQGIPARVIAGYRGGEFNYVGNYYLVRQRDAHAWVEAFLPREQIPANTMDEAEIHSGGGWLRLDPTPARDDRPNQRSVVDRMTKSFDYAQWLWSDYVLRLTPQQQAMSMMDPKNPGNRLRFGVNAQRVQQKLNETLGQDGSHWTKSWAWVVFTSSMGLFLAGYLVYRWWRNPAKWQWFKFTRKAKTKPKKAIDFYMRMEKSLARLGLRRAPSQTQLEFATFAAEQLDASAKQAPLLVVSAFYDQRFGEHPIDDERSVLIDAALHELDIVSKRRR